MDLGVRARLPKRGRPSLSTNTSRLREMERFLGNVIPSLTRLARESCRPQDPVFFTISPGR